MDQSVMTRRLREGETWYVTLPPCTCPFPTRTRLSYKSDAEQS